MLKLRSNKLGTTPKSIHNDHGHLTESRKEKVKALRSIKLMKADRSLSQKNSAVRKNSGFHRQSFDIDFEMDLASPVVVESGSDALNADVLDNIVNQVQ